MKPRHKPDPLLKKGHAHKSKKDYSRRDGSWQKEIDAGLPNLKIQDWPESDSDKQGAHE